MSFVICIFFCFDNNEVFAIFTFLCQKPILQWFVYFMPRDKTFYVRDIFKQRYKYSLVTVMYFPPWICKWFYTPGFLKKSDFFIIPAELSQKCTGISKCLNSLKHYSFSKTISNLIKKYRPLFLLLFKSKTCKQ